MCILQWGLPSLITAKLFPTQILISHWLFPCCFLLPVVIDSPCIPRHHTFSLSLIVSVLLYNFFMCSKQLRWCQVVCDNSRLMGIKRVWETQENTILALAILPNISHLLWDWVEEQAVTRVEKKGSGADYWKRRMSFSGLLMGHQKPYCMAALWSSKPFSLSHFSLPRSHVFSLERQYISAGFRREAVVASKLWSYYHRPSFLM